MGRDKGRQTDVGVYERGKQNDRQGVRKSERERGETRAMQT